MSHIVKIEGIEITDLKILEKAVKRFNGKLVKNVDTFKWYSQSQKGECDHRLEFDNCNYDVGIKENKNRTYELLFDSWYSGGLTEVLGKDLDNLKQAYSVESVKHLATMNNYTVMEKQTKEGIKLTLMAS